MKSSELEKQAQEFLPAAHALFEQAEAGDEYAESVLTFLFGSILESDCNLENS